MGALEGISVSAVNPGYIRSNISTSFLHTLDTDRSKLESGLSCLQKRMLHAAEQTFKTGHKNAATAMESTEAILHALSSPRPWAKYFPGSAVGPITATMAQRMLWLFCER